MKTENILWALALIGAAALAYFLVESIKQQAIYREMCRYDGVTTAECHRLFP